MLVDPDHTLVNEHGIACCGCTQEYLTQQRADYRKQFVELSTPALFKCVLCDKKLTIRGHTYIAKNHFLCSRRKNQHPLADRALDRLLDAVDATTQLKAMTDDETAVQVAKKFIDIYKLLKSDTSERDKQKNNTILKQLKRAKVAKRGGHA
jgi:hypothetical protein